MTEPTIAIPVEAHVKKYLLLNKNVQKPFRLSNADVYTMVLKLMIEPKRYGKFHPLYDRENIIEVGLTFDTGVNYKMYLPKQKASRFCNWVERQIKIEMMQHIETARLYGKKLSVDALIRDFEQKYDLRDTKMSFETLKRHFYRHRHTIEKAD